MEPELKEVKRSEKSETIWKCQKSSPRAPKSQLSDLRRTGRSWPGVQLLPAGESWNSGKVWVGRELKIIQFHPLEPSRRFLVWSLPGMANPWNDLCWTRGGRHPPSPGFHGDKHGSIFHPANSPGRAALKTTQKPPKTRKPD